MSAKYSPKLKLNTPGRRRLVKCGDFDELYVQKRVPATTKKIQLCKKAYAVRAERFDSEGSTFEVSGVFKV